MIQNKDGQTIRIIGLTGSIASGKTQVTDFLRKKGAYVICADELSREVVLPGQAGHRSIIQAFGKEYLNMDGSLDRRKLADRVFHDSEALKELNLILHPIIKQAVMEKLKTCHERTAIISAPLLIEAGWTDWMDEVWLVEAEDEQRLQRLMTRDKLSKQDAEARMQTQMSQEEKKKYAHIIIDNSGRLEDTLIYVAKLWAKTNHQGA